MAQTVALAHPTTGTEVTVEQASTRYRRLRLAGWTETSHRQVEAPTAQADPTPPAWLSMPDPDLDPEADLSEED